MRVIFRMDDVCPQMDYSKFCILKDIFIDNNILPVIGVVPDCKDPLLNIDNEDDRFWDRIKELQNIGWTVAMHGCYHTYTSQKNGIIGLAKRSEFAGLSYEQQTELIREGKRILSKHGIDTDVFMAPSHSYDTITLKCLQENGFKYVTDGLTRHPYRYGNLVFVPCIEARIRKVIGLSTVCYHTNTITNKRISELKKYVSNHREDVISFDRAVDDAFFPYSFLIKMEERVVWLVKYIIGNMWPQIKRIKKCYNSLSNHILSGRK